MGYNFDDEVVVSVDAESCSVCGRCARVCPTKTLAVEQGCWWGTRTSSSAGR